MKTMGGQAYVWLMKMNSFLVFCVISSLTVYQATAQPQITSCTVASNNINFYVKENTSGECVCTDTRPGVSALYWVNGSNVVQKSTKDAASEEVLLGLTVKRSDNGQQYSCISSNGSVTLSSETVTVRVAYGPDSISASNETYDLCYTSYLPLKCIPTSYNPSYQLDIYANDSLVYSGLKNGTVIPVDRGGAIEVKCVARNSNFSDVSTTKQTFISVLEPPKLDPILMINDISDTKIPISDGNISITCQVFGGFPSVNNVTVQCGAMKFSASGDKLDIMANISRDLNGKSCVCTASHVTGCYTRNATSLLDVQYKPTISNFTANGQIGSLNVTNSSTVDFVCDADGNPDPKVSIGTAKYQYESWIVSASMVCAGTGVYFCVASNDVGSSRKQFIAVNVLCPQMLKDVNQNGSIIRALPLAAANITFAVIGYPPPVDFTLKSRDRCSGAYNPVPLGYYFVGYRASGPGEGEIEVILRQFNSSSLMTYVLSHTNGLFGWSDLVFDVVPVDGRADICQPVGPGSQPVQLAAIIVPIVAVVIAVAVMAIIFWQKGIVKPCRSGPDENQSRYLGNGTRNIYQRDITTLERLSDISQRPQSPGINAPRQCPGPNNPGQSPGTNDRSQSPTENVYAVPIFNDPEENHSSGYQGNGTSSIYQRDITTHSHQEGLSAISQRPQSPGTNDPSRSGTDNVYEEPMPIFTYVKSDRTQLAWNNGTESERNSDKESGGNYTSQTGSGSEKDVPSLPPKKRTPGAKEFLNSGHHAPKPENLPSPLNKPSPPFKKKSEDPGPQVSDNSKQDHQMGAEDSLLKDPRRRYNVTKENDYVPHAPQAHTPLSDNTEMKTPWPDDPRM